MAVRGRAGVRAATALMALLTPTALITQSAPLIRLKPADAKLDVEFSRISAVRELTDGRVVVADGSDRAVWIADLRTGAVSQVGRRGSGPGEYTLPTELHALGGDTTILASGQRRWLVLVGSAIVSTTAPDDPVIAAARGLVRGFDHIGAALAWHHAGRRGGDPQSPLDSIYLVRVNRATARVDTITRIRPLASSFARMITGSDGKSVPMYVAPPLNVMEQAVIFPDGWVAVARVFPYRVDWRGRDGRWVLGTPIVVPTPLTRREKEAQMSVLARRQGGAPSDPDRFDNWPETIPEFTDLQALLAAPDGRLVVRRTPTADHLNTRYDFVDRAGRRSGQLEMPETDRIAGFGRRSVYIAWKDADDVERLRRHPWP